MPEYRVTWEIDVEADTPEDAARQAQTYQRDPDAIVGVFDVCPWKQALSGRGNFGKRLKVDLDLIDALIRSASHGKVTE